MPQEAEEITELRKQELVESKKALARLSDHDRQRLRDHDWYRQEESKRAANGKKN